MTSSPRPPAFIFNSRECLWPGMWEFLGGAGQAFTSSWRRSEEVVGDCLGWSLTARVQDLNTEGSMKASEVALEPFLTALQIALTDSWKAEGIAPSAVAGRSAGVFASGYAQGSLAHEQSIELACRVSRMISSGRTAGHVVLVPHGREWIAAVEASCPAPFYFVADGREHGTYVACSDASLAPLLEFMNDHDLQCKVEPMSVAAHSPLMDDYAEEFLRPFQLDGARSAPTPSYSSVTGDRNRDPVPASYWWDAIRQPVQVGRMFERMIADGVTTFIEIGGRSSFVPILREASSKVGTEVVVLPSMRTGAVPSTTIAESLGQLRQGSSLMSALHARLRHALGRRQ